MALFCAYLIDSGLKLTTIRSYVSALKIILKAEKYPWNDNLIMIDALTKACKLQNDKVYHRFLIKKGLLELILFETEHELKDQLYLEALYKAIFLMGYYGMMRAGEIGAERGQFCMDHALKENTFMLE